MCTPVSTTHFHLVRWLRPARWFAAADLICARKESDEVAGCERLAAAGCCGAWALWPVLRTDVLDWSHMLLAVACGGAILLAQRHLRVLRRLRRVESALARYKAECQRAQKVLAENQAHLRLALQASATGTWEWDLLSQTVRWSPECHTIFGVRPEEFDGTSAGATQRIHEIDRQRVTHAVQEAIDRQAAWDGEHRIVRPDGAVRWVRALGRALYDDQGRALRMFGTIEDVTQRKQAEREHEKLRCLGEATSDLIVTSDLQGKLTYMNAGGRRLLGLAADQDVRELQFEAFLAPEVRSRYRDTVLPAAQRDGCWAGDLRLCGPANTRLDVHCFTFLIRDQETGEPWCFGNICRDVTESRDAERVLRDREAHLRLALEASVAISFEWEIPHDRVRRLYSPELALPPTDDGTFASFLEVVHPDDRPHLQSNLEIALTSSDGTYVSEHRVVRPNGEIRWLGERGRIEFDSEHRPLRLIGIARDITTQKHAEESLRNSEATLRSFYESSPLLMGVVELLDGDDSDILHVYDSPAAERFFGSPAGRTAGRSARSLGVPAEIIALWVRCYRESQRT
ncbi:MAG: PAS domain-containing protein, partial [Pirellulaceae bacterium]